MKFVLKRLKENDAIYDVRAKLSKVEVHGDTNEGKRSASKMNGAASNWPPVSKCPKVNNLVQKEVAVKSGSAKIAAVFMRASQMVQSIATVSRAVGGA